MQQGQHTDHDPNVEQQLVAVLPRVRRFCIALSGGVPDGEDLLQETVERALQNLDRFEPGTRMDSWLFRIARNRAIDRARSARTRGTSMPIDDAVDIMGEDGRATVESRSALAATARAFAALPEEQRAVMALVVLDGASYKEAAALLEIPIGSVMSRLSRARAALDRQLHASAGSPESGEVK